jgi:signal transduction histidine kinase
MASDDNAFETVTVFEETAAQGGGLTPTKPRSARLSMLLGPQKGQTFKVGIECLIGRGADCTICLSDRGTSRHHARLRLVPDGGYVVEDLGSRNGTWVDGTRITRRELQTGAKIQIGPRCLLLFSLIDEHQEAMLEAKEAEIIGRLSAGINHDFNNLLCVLLANVAHLLELPEDVPLSRADVRECLEDMRAAAQAGAEVTAKLAVLTQGATLPQKMVDLSKLCLEMVDILRETFPKAIRIQVQVEPGIEIRGIRSHLLQMMLNPCLNARDAMPASGTLSIELGLKTADELGMIPTMKSDRYAVVTFRDTGTGMSPAVLNQAFEPFFTTREINLGRGLGLMSVRKVASDHGGTVDLHSKLGEGTTLRVVLPVIRGGDGGKERDRKERSTLEMEVPDEVLAVPSGGEAPRTSTDPARVLLVGGSEPVGRALGRALRRVGCEPVSAATAAEGLARAASTPPFDIVLIDLDEPELAGLQRQVRELRPATKLVGFTANMGQPAAEDAARFGVDYVLHKPIDQYALAAVVAMAVRTPGPA